MIETPDTGTRPPDVIIAGAGPAGCAAGALLAGWGHDVVIVTRGDSGAPALAESLPPSCRKLWRVLGAEPAIDAAGFIRTTGNTVWWGSESRVAPFAAGHGWQVTNAALGAVLRNVARSAGARFEERQMTGRDLQTAAAAFRLDCSGRAGLLARLLRVRRHEPALRTIALAATWGRQTAWAVPDESHTLLESYADGWAWSVPLSSDSGAARLRSVAVMVDPHATELARGGGARDVYLKEIAKTERFAALLDTAALVDGPHGWDASMYFSERYAGDDWLLVGDAGSFVDPLSSAGVMKALASGWLAAVAVHTALVHPDRRPMALAFYEDREREVYDALRQQTLQQLGAAAGSHDHAFWNRRVAILEDSLAFEWHPDRLRRDPAVRDAFESIRSAPAIRLRRSDDVRIEQAAAVRGREIVMERRLVSDRTGRTASLAFVCDVDVVTLAELAPLYDQVPDLYEACVRGAGPIALPDFLAALAALVARGWLERRTAPDPGAANRDI